MAYAKVGPWVNGAPPALSATNLDQVETQYDQVFTDIVHGDLGGVTTDQHHAQTHDVSDHSDIIVAVKASDETVNNNTLQNDDDLLFAVGVNEEWLVEVYLLTISGTTPDFKFAWALPAGATADGEVYEPAEGAPFGFQVVHDSTAVTASGAGALRAFKMWSVILVGGNAGNVQLQWAQNTTDAGDTKMLTGSCLIARRLS